MFVETAFLVRVKAVEGAVLEWCAGEAVLTYAAVQSTPRLAEQLGFSGSHSYNLLASAVALVVCYYE